eukprot:GHVQ01029294.1.p1 GENE.GHVQ01029294.1~~GHVQ01029294.1.p1  ORF type:complete len:408 (+),score=56.42 GHVQ01029294.1:124-1347(+)
MAAKRKRPVAVGGGRWKPIQLDDGLLNSLSHDGFSLVEEFDGPLDNSLLFSATQESCDDNQVYEYPGTERIPHICETNGDVKKKRKKSCNGRSTVGHPGDPSCVDEAAVAFVESGGKAEGSCKIGGRKKKRLSNNLKKPVAAAAGLVELDNKELATLHSSLSAWELECFLLDPAILRGLSDLKFLSPTPIQKLSLIPAARDWKDIVGAAETGSGKTLAFGLPIVHNVLLLQQRRQEKASETGMSENPADCCLLALIILPSRELAVQVHNHIQAISKHTTLRIVCVLGGMAVQKQKRLLAKSPEVVIGTPGRLWELMDPVRTDDTEACCLRDLAGLRFLVLDEADRLVEDGHFKEMDSILKSIYKAAGRLDQLQTFVFSSTLVLPQKYASRHKSEVNGGKRIGQILRL